MNILVKTLACASAVVAASAAWAQFEDEADFDEPVDSEEVSSADEEEAEAESEESEAPAGEKKAEVKTSRKVSLDKPFHLMPLCRLLEGVGEVRRPGAAGWVAIEEGRFYPLGSAYRTAGASSRMAIQFGDGSEVLMSGSAAFVTLPQTLGEKRRVIALDAGTITVKLPRGLAPGMFAVTAPGFTVENLEGDSRYTYRRTGDGDEAVVRCVTGTMAMKGRHFSIEKMSAANELKVRTSHDNLFTGLFGNSGDIVVKLDQGMVSVQDFETKEFNEEPRYLDWHLSPKTAVRIHRAVPEIGDRMSVAVMTFDINGELQNRCAFAEGRSEINSGEEGAGVLAKQEEDAAKKAAEAAETIALDEEEEEEEESDDASASDDEDSSSDGADEEEEDF